MHASEQEETTEATEENNATPTPEQVEAHYESLLQNVQKELADRGHDISRETVELVIGHFFSGFQWILKQTPLQPGRIEFEVLDLEGANAAIIQDSSEDITTLVISSKLFLTAQEAVQMAHEHEIEPSEVIVDMDIKAGGIPPVSYSLEDHIQAIGVEEGTHWIQGFVSRGQEIPGFTESRKEESIVVQPGETVEEALSRFQFARDGLENLLTPHEMNARFWINEFFKYKKSDENTFEEFYTALLALFEKRKKEKKSPLSAVKNFFTGKKKE